MDHGFGWLVMLLVGLVLIFALVELISWIFGNNNIHNSNTKENSNAINIAKERYAKGEITKEQFDQFKKDL